MRDVLTSDVILLVVQGEDNMCDMLEILDWGVGGEEIVRDKEHQFQEGPEQECPVMACALGVFVGLKAEVEPQLDQVGNMPVFGVGGGGCRRHNGVDDAQVGGILPLDWEIFDPIKCALLVKVLVQADVSLGVEGGALGSNRPYRR